MKQAEKSDQGSRARSIGDFVALTKPGLTFVSVSTAVGGAFLAMRGYTDYFNLLYVFIGAYLAGAGAGAVNQYIERDSDARMTRTGLRPVSARRIRAKRALFFGAALSVVGILFLVVLTTLTAGILALGTLAVYLGLYTPMKRKTPAALYIGGIAGALPPVIGWTAAGGGITTAGLSLSGILFLWQIPHFLSLAWLYREDYARAGFKVGTVTDPTGISAGRQILCACLLLIPVTLLPSLTGTAGKLYVGAALVMSSLYSAAGFLFYREKTVQKARMLFITSVIFIPVLFAVLVADKLAG